ncbi:hypothetical protein [Sphingopyxis sp.]|uniref:hypothetical protein n=1 Tax=Sphingopyxis sp. TaxID=1908224 RepID=UPI002D7652E8|nr:hypothetical protein [Sphingopyxis sp.]HET6526826.1 hypothetical protein [Sphingopyxis sp.]
MTPDPKQTRAVPANMRTNPFRRHRKVPPLALHDAQRQGAISALAFQLLGGRDPAVDFLNTQNDPLGGRPIAIATQSDAGYASVEREIRSRALSRSEPHAG